MLFYSFIFHCTLCPEKQPPNTNCYNSEGVSVLSDILHTLTMKLVHKNWDIILKKYRTRRFYQHILLLLHPFSGLFCRTMQKGKTSLDLNDARDDVVWGCSGISWTICKHVHLAIGR